MLRRLPERLCAVCGGIVYLGALAKSHLPSLFNHRASPVELHDFGALVCSMFLLQKKNIANTKTNHAHLLPDLTITIIRLFHLSGSTFTTDQPHVDCGRVQMYKSQIQLRNNQCTAKRVDQI